MVSHRIVLRGSSGSTQTVQAAQQLDCSEALLTSIIVQLSADASTLDVPVGATRTESGTAVPQGLYGVSLAFEDSVIPHNAMYHAGAEREYSLRDRIDVDFSTDSKSSFHRPGLLFKNITFKPKYTVRFMYPEMPHVELTEAAMGGIGSIVLNFECNVRNIVMS